MKRILKDSAKCIFVFCFFVGQLLGCSQEATLDNTEGVGDGVVAPVLPFQQLVTFASGDSQHHVTKDFSLSLDNGSWTSSDTSVLSVDSSGRAIIKEYSGGGYSRDIELRNERGRGCRSDCALSTAPRWRGLRQAHPSRKVPQLPPGHHSGRQHDTLV